MSFPFVIHSEALEELIEAADWYELQRPGLGDEFLEAVHTSLERAVPLAVVDEDFLFRRVLLRRFPYTVILIEDPEVGPQVVAVGHQRRAPDYWKYRLEEGLDSPGEPTKS